MKMLALPYIDDPAQAFAAFANLPYALFFDSGHPYDQRERFSIIAAAPTTQFLVHGKMTTIKTGHHSQQSTQDPFELIKNHLNKHRPLHYPDAAKILPFKLGAMGYFSYDLAQRYFNLEQQIIRDIKLPDAVVGIYDWSLIIDHHDKKTWLLTTQENPALLLAHIQRQLDTPIGVLDNFKLTKSFNANFNFDQYAQAFKKIQTHIRHGDCYQVNLCQRFSASYTGSLWQAYQQLRRINPAPFAIYMNLGKQAILSLSPERFLKVTAQQVETKPIKGTMARDADVEKDRALKIVLQTSEKNRAENLMIVDLLRNDLGKCCMPGSIQVPSFAALETFPQVHHLVSTIKGHLPENVHALDLLRHCFPGGSITGAPKKSAMQVIASLEPHHRSVYCGSIGYINYDGDMDCNIAIRTLIADEDRIYCYGGGGIVADSELNIEYQESIVKISNLIEKLAAL